MTRHPHRMSISAAVRLGMGDLSTVPLWRLQRAQRRLDVAVDHVCAASWWLAAEVALTAAIRGRG